MKSLPICATITRDDGPTAALVSALCPQQGRSALSVYLAVRKAHGAIHTLQTKLFYDFSLSPPGGVVSRLTPRCNEYYLTRALGPSTGPTKQKAPAQRAVRMILMIIRTSRYTEAKFPAPASLWACLIPLMLWGFTAINCTTAENTEQAPRGAYHLKRRPTRGSQGCGARAARVGSAAERQRHRRRTGAARRSCKQVSRRDGLRQE